MKIEYAKLVCFSPTGTTKRVIQGIASGFSPNNTKLIDITTPNDRKQSLLISENELLIVGVPVYMGRVPDLINEWLNSIQAHNTPTVCVVVYGNRTYDNALLELKDIVVKRGCTPVAGAAYIGEHAFSDSEAPTAEGRPDEDDLNHAKSFGHKIREKIASISSVSQVSDLYVPGSFPYEGITDLWNVDFIAVDDSCSQCGLCAERCPVGAVDSQDSAIIDHNKCVTCCACIKNCPQNAKTMKPGLVKDAQNRVTTLYSEPKEPEYFL